MRQISKVGGLKNLMFISALLVFVLALLRDIYLVDEPLEPLNYLYLLLLILVICLGTALSMWLLPGVRSLIMTRMGNQSAPAYWLFLALNMSIVLYTMVVSSTLDTGNPRYRVPVEPLIWLTIALSVRVVRDLRRFTHRPH